MLKTEVQVAIVLFFLFDEHGANLLKGFVQMVKNNSMATPSGFSGDSPLAISSALTNSLT